MTSTDQVLCGIVDSVHGQSLSLGFMMSTPAGAYVDR